MRAAAALPAAPRSPVAPARIRFVPLAFVLVGLAILVSLGSWQLRRLGWKTRLIAHVEALKTAPAQPLSAVLARAARGEDVDFTRVTTACPTLERTSTLRLYALNDAGMGYRVITACPAQASTYRSVLVDRGFVLHDEAGRLHPSAEDIAQPLVGVLRRGDPPSWIAPRHTARGADWFGRDVAAMAAELGAPSPAPLFLMLESPPPRGFGPTPQPLPGEIRNPHLGYALTWFGLAAALAGVYLASLLRPSPPRA